MSASDNLSDHIKRFAPHAEGAGWHTCEGAGGSCEVASEDFRGVAGGKHLQFAGAKFDTSSAHPEWQKVPSEHMSHHVPVVDDHVVDWTYRQFDPTSEFPLVEHVDDYSKRWDRNYDVTPYWDEDHKGPINK